MEDRWKALPRFLEILGYDEEPMGVFYTDQKPLEGFTPAPLDLPTREKEKNQQIDWQATFGDFSCVIGHIWRARKKKRAAFFDAGHFGCPGGAFFLGCMKPQTETDLPPVFVPVFKLELNPILNCFVSTEVVES